MQKLIRAFGIVVICAIFTFSISSCKKGTCAVCNDGTTSYSKGRGTCSWHGGVDHYTDPNEISVFKTAILLGLIFLGGKLYFSGDSDKKVK